MKIRWLVLGVAVVGLLVPAFMLTGARILEPGGGRGIRLVSFTPYAIGLYALAVVLLLLVLARGRGTWRRVGGWSGVLVLLLLGLHVLWVSEMYVGATDDAARPRATFTVMTANLLRGDADPTRVVQLAREHDVDICVLSEITARAQSAIERAGLAKALPHSAGEAGPGVSGTMIFSAREMSAVTPLDTSLRGFSLDVEMARRTVHLIAVHPAPPTGDASQWRADHATIRRDAGAASGPTVIAGDLNATRDHQPLRELSGRGFEDAAEQANSGWQPTWPASGEVALLGVPVPPLLSIDHVLVHDGLSVIDTEAVSIPGTDHRALFATLAAQ